MDEQQRENLNENENKHETEKEHHYDTETESRWSYNYEYEDEDGYDTDYRHFSDYTSAEEEEEYTKVAPPVQQEIVEEEEYVEEPPPDPAAPYDLSDSKEALLEPFELRPDQIAEIEQLWALYQDHTPVYSEIDGFITEKELIYLLKCLLILPFTPEQLQELIVFCVRPPHPKGHITYDQFMHMVIIRMRDFPREEELRLALQVMDPEKTNILDRDYLKYVLKDLGHKMIPKQLDYLIKEVDITNDGTLGVEDIVGTMCLDLNMDDIIMLRNALNPDQNKKEEVEDF